MDCVQSQRVAPETPPTKPVPHRAFCSLLEDYSPFVIPNAQHRMMEGHQGNVKCVEFLGEEGHRLASGSRYALRCPFTPALDSYHHPRPKHSNPSPSP